jgi:hypothetical protein
MATKKLKHVKPLSKAIRLTEVRLERKRRRKRKAAAG